MQRAQSIAADAHVFSVRELNRTVRDLLEAGLGAVWVEGEMSNLARPASGHIYFSLKDNDAQVRCAMFRNRNRMLDFAPEAGVQVRVRARVSVYEARGEYQLIVEDMEPAGAGDLARAFEILKKRLAAEGLFAAERKRALPAFPHRIGVVTSATGAALRDVLQVLARRFAAIPVIVYPTAVQGSTAPAAIADRLQRAGRRAECDVLLLVRGGGSLEDLQAFNEEAVARAIVACPLPVVTGVGHEVDVTIADFAADQRAPTPSAAAELVTPDAVDLLRRVVHLDHRQRAAMDRLLERARLRRAGLERRLRRQQPSRRLEQWAQRRDELATRLARAGHGLLDQRRRRLGNGHRRLLSTMPLTRMRALAARRASAEARLERATRERLRALGSRVDGVARALHAVSPLATLGRGYALVRRQDTGQPVTTATQVAPGDLLAVELARGGLDARVEARREPDPDSS